MRITKSSIFLRGLRFHAYHGVGEQEQIVGNDYTVDLRMALAVDKAAVSDDVADTVNYAEVYAVVAQEMRRPHRLLESLAYRIGQSLFERFPEISSLCLSVAKLNPPMGTDGGSAGVELHLINDKTIL